MVEIVTRPDLVTAEWMDKVLRQSGRLESGSVRSLDHKIIGTGKMGDNARFTLNYEGGSRGAPNSVIVKFPAEDETARMMASELGAYYNEVMFYRHLAHRTEMRTPVIYANEISDDKSRFITVMEDLAPAEPGSQFVGESLTHAKLVMVEAAKLAAAFYDDESVSQCDYVVTQMDDGGSIGQALLQEHWPRFLDRFGQDINPECQEFGNLYVDNHTIFINRFKGPKTLAHGDLRSENILFACDESACTVDWQTILQASPLTDLAYFMGGSVEVEDRRNWERDLVREYSDTLATLGVQLDSDECWKQYREQAMHGLIMPILGWSFSEPEERSDAMFLVMMQRHLQHCVDLDAREFLS